MKKRIITVLTVMGLSLLAGCATTEDTGKDVPTPTRTEQDEVTDKKVEPIKKAEPTVGPTATNTPMPIPTNTLTPTPTNTPTPTPTNTPTPTLTNTPMPTPTPTIIPVPEAGADALTYTETEEGTIIITGLKDESLSGIVIPSMINGKPVTIIYDSAFRNCKSLQIVIIEDGVTRINRRAFDGCSNLDYVEIPSSVAYIEEKYREESFSSSPMIFTPRGSYAETWAKNEGNTVVYGIYAEAGSDIEKYRAVEAKETPAEAFSYEIKDSNVIITGLVDTTLTDVVVPGTIEGHTVTEIGSNAFGSNPTLYSIELPDSVTLIDDNAFYFCSSLKAVRLSKGLKTIGFGAFSDCIALESIYIPNGVETIEMFAFCRCTGLKAISIPKSVTTVGDDMISSCTNLKDVILSKGIKVIPSFFFCNCISLTSIEIPDGVVEIGTMAFADCTSLVSLTLPTSIYILGNSIADNCPKLTTVYTRYECTAGEWADWNGYQIYRK